MHGPWRRNMNLSCLFCIFYSLSFVRSLRPVQSVWADESWCGYTVHNRRYVRENGTEHVEGCFSKLKIPHIKKVSFNLFLRSKYSIQNWWQSQFHNAIRALSDIALYICIQLAYICFCGYNSIESQLQRLCV